MLKILHLGVLLNILAVLLPVRVDAAGQVNVFIYHRFDESRYPSTNISSAVFTEQLAYLKENNYTVLSLGETARRLASGAALPEKGAALCIDDAFTSFAEVAMPLFRRYGFPVTLFVNTAAVGTPGYLDWDALKQLQQEGVEIGNHTATHAYLVERKAGEDDNAWRARIKADIAKAQQQLAEQLGVDAELFAYPYGEYSSEVVQVVKEAGFLAAFAQQSGVIHPGSDPLLLPRFPMGGPYATTKGFISKLRMKPLLVAEEMPLSPLMIENPPLLQLRIADQEAHLRQINCFAQGDNRCRVEAVAGKDGWFRVIAQQPLSGRRNKYTLTAPGKQGGWHWYSHLWVKAENPVLSVKEKNLLGKSAAQPQVGAGEAGKPVLLDQ